MPSKKSLNKELREEIQQLKQELFKAKATKELLLQQARRDYKHKCDKIDHILSHFEQQLGYVSGVFSKELMWVQLSDDQESPTAILKNSIAYLDVYIQTERKANKRT